MKFADKIKFKHLHSNMERFKGALSLLLQGSRILIYIPIWRDLKISFSESKITSQVNLHSNMERFKAVSGTNTQLDKMEFTFQYGEI